MFESKINNPIALRQFNDDLATLVKKLWGYLIRENYSEY